MTYTEEQVNAGILVKALYENVLKGKTSYNIHPLWWEQTDVSIFDSLISNDFIRLEDKKISFTEHGFTTVHTLIKELAASVPSIPVGEIYSYLQFEATQILTTLNIK